MAKRKKEEAISNEKDTKDSIARQKVEALLSDVPSTLIKAKAKSDEDESDDALETLEKSKGNAWLENQLNALTERNEALEAELESAKTDFKRLSADFVEFRKKAGLPPSDSELQLKIVSLFKKFEKAYTGNNPERIRYTSIKFTNHPNNTGVLDEFIKAFGDLLKTK